jgi:hypothetical protein
VAHESPREQSIERLLRQGAGLARVSPDPSSCLDGEVLSAWASGALPAAEAARVEGHVSDCARCLSLLAAFARTDLDPPPPVSWWRRWDVRWLVPLATAATVAAIWVAIPTRELSESKAPQTSARADAGPPVAEPPRPAPPAQMTQPATKPATIDQRTADARSQAALARKQLTAIDQFRAGKPAVADSRASCGRGHGKARSRQPLSASGRTRATATTTIVRSPRVGRCGGAADGGITEVQLGGGVDRDPIAERHDAVATCRRLARSVSGRRDQLGTASVAASNRAYRRPFPG